MKIGAAEQLSLTPRSFQYIASVLLLRDVLVPATGTRLLTHNPAGRVSNDQHAEATYLWLVFKY